MKRTFFITFLINLLVYNIAFANQKSTNFETLKHPSTNSNSIIILDRKSLLPLYEKNAYTKVSMASTTKILTCILALENSNLNESVTISQKASSISGSCLGLKPNTQISMNDLLYGLMLRSGNDCAIAISEHISGSVEKFSILMNQKAFELGLFNSNFVSPHGLDNENHYTTAYDLALLTNYALNNNTFKKIVSTKSIVISYNNSACEIFNTNELLGNLDGVYGVKTGFTFESGRCLVSACKRNFMDIIVVVLGADTKQIRTSDSKSLINYIFENYEYIDLSNKIDTIFNEYLFYFNKNYKLEKTQSIPTISLQKPDNTLFPIYKNNSSNINTKIFCINNFNPSISTGTTVGKIEVYNQDVLLCSANIILENKLTQNNWLFYFKKMLSYYK